MLDDPALIPFVTLLQTAPAWEDLHTVYVQHLGTETAKGESYKECKRNIAHALSGLKVVVVRWAPV